MALYLVDGALVRAANGHRAIEIAGTPDSKVKRVREDGPEEVIHEPEVAVTQDGYDAMREYEDAQEA